MKENKTLLIVTTVVILGIFGFLFYNNQSAVTVDEGPYDIEYIDEEINEVPDTGITAADILDDPNAYEGMEVTLRAEVEDSLSTRSFLLDAAGIVDDKLLVVTDSPQLVFEDPEIFGDAIWEVQGVVEQFEYQVVVDTFDLDGDPDLFAVYEGRPYILADVVMLYED